MTAYVLYQYGDEWAHIEGVFTSREKAEAHAAKDRRGGDWEDYWEIEECVIDAAEAKEWRPCHVVWMYTDGATVEMYAKRQEPRPAGEIDVRPEMEDRFIEPGGSICQHAHMYDRRIKVWSAISVEHAIGLAREEYARHLERRRADEERLAAAATGRP